MKPELVGADIMVAVCAWKDIGRVIQGDHPKTFLGEESSSESIYGSNSDD